ncbi:BMY1 [Symbiodinium necroappetens]|uniref:BMY1 protein n=1 Tax=Symbiodinium necroappetens TaxID=1628268 RepID=A0A812NDM3_9DINO|nr:BMY1 [Symbiodinium necroappetens]
MLKRELQRLSGIPRFRQQRLVHESGTCLEEEAELQAMTLQLVVLPFASASELEMDEIIGAAASGVTSKVQEFLQKQIDPNFLGYNDEGVFVTPLVAACEKGHTEVAELLLQAGADKESCDTGADSEQRKVVSKISQMVDKKLASKMLEGFDDFARRLSGWLLRGATLEFYVCHVDILCLLLEARADKDSADSVLGNSPLRQAVAKGRAQIASLLLLG